MEKTFAEIIEAMGGKVGRDRRTARRRSRRAADHSRGRHRADGRDPKKSVTNAYGQCVGREEPVRDRRRALCSNADKNPTLSILALAWRASDHMLGLMKRKEL